MPVTQIVEGVFFTGAHDPDLRVFDVIMETEYGTSYNSYLVKGKDKVALFETVKEKFYDGFIKNLQELVNINDIDYLVVNHTEPDHSGSIEKLLAANPKITVVGTETAIGFLKEIVNKKFQVLQVGHNDTLDIGGKTLRFINAPFLHWPDSMFTYLEEDGILFSCDSFGCHYADERIFNDLMEDEFIDAYKYYFDMIMGPFKSYVREALEKIKDLKLNMICPGHGPVLRKDIPKYLELYKQWSELPAKEGVLPKIVIPYASAYGFTKQLGETIVEGIQTAGDFNIKVFDMVDNDTNTVLEELSNADALLVGSCTINGDALPPIWDILTRLSPIVHNNLLAAAFGAYGWSGEAVPNIESRLRSLRMDVIPGIKVNFKPSEGNLEKAFNFGMDFGKALLAKGLPKSDRKWRCVICGHIHQGEEPPAICPACGVGKTSFVPEIQEEEFANNTQEKFVILGSGIAGISAAKAIRERNKTATIDIITEEAFLPYYRPMLSDYIAPDADDKGLYIENEAWYQQNSIKVSTQVLVTEINAAEKKVICQGNNELPYDKLIIATGARSNIPPIPGADKAGVYALRNLQDAKSLKSAIAGAKKAVVIGGGILGLEAVWEMVQAGLQVSVVEFFATLMPRQLDPASGKRLQEIIESKGVKLYMGRQTKEITGADRVQGVMLDNGDLLDADLVLLSTGVKPNIELALNAGIACKQGVIVDNQMRTSAPGVYAAGDMAQFNDKLIGIWPIAMEMGKTAGAAAAGDWVEYKEPRISAMLMAFDKEIFSIGEVNWPEGECRIVEVIDPKADYYKKSFFINGVLKGEIVIAAKAEGLESMEQLGRDESGAEHHDKWKCKICSYIHEGPEPPDTCPVCGAGKDMFEPAD